MRILIVCVLVFTALSAAAAADDSTGENIPKADDILRVVELFTSQGCSSCPSANGLVNRMAEEQGTLALSYGVTYWDYLGWKDTFADPEFTDRQRAYSEFFDMANLYTPQIVLNGMSHGAYYSDRDALSMVLAADRPAMTLKLSGPGLTGHVDRPSGKYGAILIEYVHGPQSVPVTAGENRGHTLTLSNVVTDVEDLGVWDTSMTLEVVARDQVTVGKSYALLLHERNDGRIASAARYTP